MILVLGNSSKKVELKDLDDVVYYKQQKSFNDSDFERSNDLKREINSGRLIILSNSKDATPTNDGKGFTVPLPTPVETITVIKEVSVPEVTKETVTTDTSNQVTIDADVLNQLIQKVSDLESRISDAPASNSIDTASLVASIIEGIGGKMVANQPSHNDNLSGDKLDRILDLVKSGNVSGVQAPKMSDYTKPTRADEVYVPSIRVEDGNAKINLETRVIDGGSDVSNALDILKRMKNNQ